MNQVVETKNTNIEVEITNLESYSSEIRKVADLKKVLRRLNSVQKIVFDELKRRNSL